MGGLPNVAVLIGIVAGAALAASLGMMSFDKVAKASWFEVVMPFNFGMPIFEPVSIISMCLVMMIVLIESTGMFLALGEITGRKVGPEDLKRGLRADGVGAVLGGIFNTFPYTSFSQNTGLVAVTGVRSRFVCVAAGVFLMLLGLTPKIAQLVEAVPVFVLGGAGIVMFGMVAATGVRILQAVDFANNRHNLFIVAISVGFGMIPMVSGKFFQYMPKAVAPLFYSGIMLASIAAVALNFYYNGAKRSAEEAARDAAATSLGHE